MEFEKILREQIEINKKNAIKEIQNEEIIPAMWSVSTLIDLKAQENLLKKQKKESEDNANK